MNQKAVILKKTHTIPLQLQNSQPVRTSCDHKTTTIVPRSVSVNQMHDECDASSFVNFPLSSSNNNNNNISVIMNTATLPCLSTVSCPVRRPSGTDWASPWVWAPGGRLTCLWLEVGGGHPHHHHHPTSTQSLPPPVISTPHTPPSVMEIPPQALQAGWKV